MRDVLHAKAAHAPPEVYALHRWLTSLCLTKNDTAGEVIFREDYPADTLLLQVHAALALCLFLTSPSVAHERVHTTSYEKSSAIFRKEYFPNNETMIYFSSPMDSER